MILQVKVTVSPSLIRLFAPEILTSGRTLNKQVKKLKHSGFSYTHINYTNILKGNFLFGLLTSVYKLDKVFSSD